MAKKGGKGGTKKGNAPKAPKKKFGSGFGYADKSKKHGRLG